MSNERLATSDDHRYVCVFTAEFAERLKIDFQPNFKHSKHMTKAIPVEKQENLKEQVGP